MKRLVTIGLVLVAISVMALPASAAKLNSQLQAYTGFPTFSIVSVVKDQSVTIKTNNLPPNDTFTVTMGKIGTKGIGGISVGSTNSGEGGVLTLTYNTPASLVDLTQISIRLQSPTSGYFAYNWFYNTTATGTVAPTQAPSPTSTPSAPGYTGFPTFSISAVIKDQTVTISGKNFPANDTFSVYMGKSGTLGIGGINVGSTNSGSGGSMTATYNIPASLAGSSIIAIRLQSPTSGYFAYNWFWNSTTTP